MLNYTRSQIFISSERDVLLSEAGLIQSGMALVSGGLENGIAKAKRSTATTTESFWGVAMMQNRGVNVQKKVETITVPVSPYTVALKKLPAGTIGAFQVSDGALVAVTAGAASTTNIQSVTANGVTSLVFDSSFAGAQFNIVYDFASTASEDTYVVGEVAGSPPTAILNKVGIIQLGVAYTDQFITNALIFGATALKSVATGKFDGTGGTGTALAGRAELLAVPTIDNPYAAIRLG